MTTVIDQNPARDAECCKLVQSGRDAMSELLERHKGLVHGIVSKMHLQAGVEEDELIQVGLIALTHAAGKWVNDGRSKFGSYAWTCINNAVRRSAGEQARKASSLHQRPLDDSGSEILDMLPAPEPVELPVDVRARLERLPVTWRKVLSMRWGLDGEPMGWGEIAAVTGLTVAQAKRAEQLALASV
jgi:RNA polymerase sigma factor (sigma-70 family)